MTIAEVETLVAHAVVLCVVFGLSELMRRWNDRR